MGTATAILTSFATHHSGLQPWSQSVPIILRLRKLSNYCPWIPFSTVRLTLWDLDLLESSSGLPTGHHGRRLFHAALSGQPSAKQYAHLHPLRSFGFPG